MKLMVSKETSKESKELLVKSLKNLNDYEMSGFQWIREYQESLIKYIEDVVQAIGIGLCLKLDVEPDFIYKSQSYKIPTDILLKSANNEEISDFYKAVFTQLRSKFSKMSKDYKKFNFNKGKPLDPISFKGRIIYDETTRKPMTNETFESMSQDVEDYLQDSMGNLDDLVILRAAMMGKMMEKMEREGTTLDKQKRMSWEEIKSKFGDLPDDEEGAKDNLDMSSVEQQAIRYAKGRAGEYLSVRDGDLKKKVIDVIRKQITEGLHDGLSAQEMSQRLFRIDPQNEEDFHLNKDTLEAFNRNWRRVAITEFSFALNNGYLMAHKADSKPGEKIYFVFDGRYNPQESARGPNSCNEYLGKICLLVDTPMAADSIDDEYAEFAIWAGKNNTGRGKDGWCCIPVHPHCTHFWSRCYPDIMVWDDEMKKMVFRTDDTLETSFRNEGIDLIKGKQVFVPASGGRRSYYRIDPRMKHKEEIKNKNNKYGFIDDYKVDSRYSEMVQDMRKKHERIILNYHEGKNKPIATSKEGKYTYHILDDFDNRKILISNEHPDKPIATGKWMDFPEKHWNISDNDYKKLPKKERAEMETKEQLRYSEKEYKELYLNFYHPDEWANFWFEGRMQLSHDSQYDTRSSEYQNAVNGLYDKVTKNDELKKSDVHVDNIEWDDKRAKIVKEELAFFANEVKDFLKLKNPIIVHLYKGQDGDRGEYDEGVILLYEDTPDWRGDFCHELGHQLIRKKTIDEDPIVKVKLKAIKSECEKNKGDGRVFVQEHTYSNIKEVAVTLFKWWLLGKIVNDAYTNVLKFYQPSSIEILKRLMSSDFIEKSYEKVGSEGMMLKAFFEDYNDMFYDMEA